VSGVVAMAGGVDHSVALKGDGSVWAWGLNTDGQLGDGSTTNRLSPVQVTGLSGAGKVAAGRYHSLAVTGGSMTATTSYGYDGLYRLTSVGGTGGTTSYEYDPVGNRQSMTRGSQTSYSYDRADRIATAGSVSYTVNANGNLVVRGTDSFGYDQANMLKTASVGGVSSSYGYDGDGKRASKTVGITTTGYVYDVNASLPRAAG